MHGLAQQHRRRSVGSMLVVALGAALVALAVSAAPALAQTQLYVSTGGSDADNNNCQTQASPCLTIGQAVAGAADGDTMQHRRRHLQRGDQHLAERPELCRYQRRGRYNDRRDRPERAGAVAVRHR